MLAHDISRAWAAKRLTERGWRKRPAGNVWQHEALTGCEVVDLVEAFLLQNRALRSEPHSTLVLHNAITDPNGDWLREVTPAVPS